MSKKEKKTRHEAKVFNRISGAVHGGLTGASSNIRLSLTLRIASHYCFQLFRTFLLSAVLLTLAFSLGIGLQLREPVRRIVSQAPDLEDGVYSQLIIRDSRISAVRTEERPGDGWKESLRFHFRALISDRFPSRLVFYVLGGSHPVRLTLDTAGYRTAWLCLMGGFLLTDLLRMLYFVRKRKRLDKRVLAPIRDITEMAQTLSAANLSNRINIAGTKNELRDLAVVINSMLDRIELSYNSQKQFVSDASHELRTPIAVIRGYADMLRRWGKDDPTVLDEGIGAISQEAESMKDLVENLLFLARHDKKTLMLEMQPFSALELVREVQQESGMVTSGDRFTVNPAEDVSLTADRGLIKQLLRILVDNAVKYAPEGSEITLGVRRAPAGCLLTVADQGCGISPEDLPRIFERFYRADSSRSSETSGHGLGLSIARIITLSHHGQIRVRSKVGEGTTFEITLPLDGNA